MFWDDLCRIDRGRNAVAILGRIRLRAYYEFRDQSEPEEIIAHSGPPRRMPVVLPYEAAEEEGGYCDVCGHRIEASDAFREHMDRHRRRGMRLGNGSLPIKLERRREIVREALRERQRIRITGMVVAPPAPVPVREVLRVRELLRAPKRPVTAKPSRVPVPLPAGDRGAFLRWECSDCGRVLFMWEDSGAPGDCPHCYGCKWTASPWAGRAA